MRLKSTICALINLDMSWISIGKYQMLVSAMSFLVCVSPVNVSVSMQLYRDISFCHHNNRSLTLLITIIYFHYVESSASKVTSSTHIFAQ